MKPAVEVLCRRDTNLVCAEHTLHFMVRNLEDLNSILSEKLINLMKKRISECRINATAAYLYLKNPYNYPDDLELLKCSQSSQLPNQSIVRKEIKHIIKRLNRSLRSSSHASISDNVINTTALNVENEDGLPLSMIADYLNLPAAKSI